MILLFLSALFAAKSTDIALLHRPAQRIEAGKPFVVSGTMVGASEVEHAEVRYRMNGGSFFERAELEIKQGDDYEATIPADAVRQGYLEYYVVAFDFLGKAREVFATAKRPQRVLVELAAITAAPDTPPSKPPPTEKPADKPPPVVSAPAAAPAEIEGGVDIGRFVFEESDLDIMASLTVADVLERIPELQMSRGIDGVYRTARGGVRDEAAVLVLIDGQPLTTLSVGAPDLRLPLAAYKRVEVTLGSASALDNAGPLATVRLETRGGSKNRFDARAVAGGYLSQTTGPGSKTIGSYDAALSGGGTVGMFEGSARAAVHYSGGAQPLVREDALLARGLSLAPGNVEDRALRLHGGGTFALKLGGAHRLQAQVDFIRLDHGHYAGSYDLFSPAGGIDSNTLRVFIGARSVTPSAFQYEAGVGYRLATYGDDRLVVPPDYRTTDRNDDGQIESFSNGVTDVRRFTEHVLDVDARASYAMGTINRIGAHAAFSQHIVGDASFQREATLAGVPAPLGENDLPRPTRLSRSNLSIALADRFTPARWLDADVGVRFSLAGDLGVGADLGSLLTPVAKIDFRPVDGLLLRVSYDTAARGSTLLECCVPAPFDERGIGGNPNLRYMAVRQAAFDAIYENVAGPLRLRGEVRAGYFGARGARVLLDSGGVDVPADAMSVDGIEASAFARASFATRSFVRFGVSWHRAFAQVANINAVTLLTDTPQLAGVAMTRIELGPVGDIFFGATFYSERRNNARTDTERRRPFRLPASAVASAQFQSRAFYGFRALLLAQNVFDAERFDDAPRPDQLPGLVPREGFRLMAGLMFGFDGGGK